MCFAYLCTTCMTDGLLRPKEVIRFHGTDWRDRVWKPLCKCWEPKPGVVKFPLRLDYYILQWSSLNKTVKKPKLASRSPPKLSRFIRPLPTRVKNKNQESPQSQGSKRARKPLRQGTLRGGLCAHTAHPHRLLDQRNAAELTGAELDWVRLLGRTLSGLLCCLKAVLTAKFGGIVECKENQHSEIIINSIKYFFWAIGNKVLNAKDCQLWSPHCSPYAR